MFKNTLSENHAIVIGVLSDGSPGGGSSAAPPAPEQQPNALLLEQFLRRMEDAHDRELHLQDEECRYLRDLILQRPRDHGTNPLPLREEPTGTQTSSLFHL